MIHEFSECTHTSFVADFIALLNDLLPDGPVTKSERVMRSPVAVSAELQTIN